MHKNVPNISSDSQLPIYTYTVNRKILAKVLIWRLASGYTKLEFAKFVKCLLAHAHICCCKMVLHNRYFQTTERPLLPTLSMDHLSCPKQEVERANHG